MNLAPTANDLKQIEVREELLSIAQEGKGMLDPNVVLERARNEDSPLHDFFEWDESRAAEGFRLVQAQALIRRFRLVIVREGKEEKELKLHLTREFHSLPGDRKKNGGYRRLPEVLNDEEYTAELLQQALKDLEALRRKYETLSELEVLWKEMDELKTRVLP